MAVTICVTVIQDFVLASRHAKYRTMKLEQVDTDPPSVILLFTLVLFPGIKLQSVGATTQSSDFYNIYRNMIRYLFTLRNP